MANNRTKIPALRIPAERPEVRFVSVDIKSRQQDDGNAEIFWEEAPDLSPGLGDAFQQRRSSDFHVRNVEDPDYHFPYFIRSNDSTIYGRYSLYYTVASALPINKSCEKYIGFNPLGRQRILERRSIYRLTGTIEGIQGRAYQSRRLESMLEIVAPVKVGLQMTYARQLQRS